MTVFVPPRPAAHERKASWRARARQFLLRDTPDCGHVAAGLGIIYAAIARQLVCLLAMFTPPLAVPLSGQTAVAAEGLPDRSDRQRKVDVRESIGNTLRLLLGAPGS